MTDKEFLRFMGHIHVGENGCWIWLGTKTGSGYGYFKTGSLKDGTRRNVLPHRYSYEHKKGSISEGLQIDHLCRHQLCVNPDHLEAVTPKENVRRSSVCKAYCPQGHEKTGIRQNGYKFCRICGVLRDHKRRIADPERARALERDQYRRRQAKKLQIAFIPDKTP